MTAFDFDAVVVGAGAVGLACGYALAQRGSSVVVVEREPLIGAGVSSRNSEVIHAGLYYPTGSLKARLCVQGRLALYHFLEAHGVPYDRCGKLVVATEPDEGPRLDAIASQAEINGVEGVRRLSGAAARALEPQLRVVEALLSPDSGVFDSHGYMLALQGEIEDRGGSVVTGAPFERAEPLPGGGFDVQVGGADPTRVRTRLLVIAAGLGAQACAAAVEGFPDAQIPSLHFGKGSYFSLAGPAPFRRLIYPPPIPGALGVHYRRDLGGRACLGPDLQFIETEDYTVDPSRAGEFYAYVRRFWPGLPDGALSPDYAGIRPKLHGQGEAQPDFSIVEGAAFGLPNLVALFGIESPGLTSSLAIGSYVADMLEPRQAR
jgi:L-2-hydroxyglutarate oxidase LhgO